MKLFGHPLHMIFIHFPSALLPMDLFCSCLYYWQGNTALGQAAFFAMTGGVIVGWIAVIIGLYDLLPITRRGAAALRCALTHGGLNFVVILGYSLLAFTKWKLYPALAPDFLLTLSIKAMLICCMVFGNYFGARLILKYNIAKENE